jgi:hypothetical protein
MLFGDVDVAWSSWVVGVIIVVGTITWRPIRVLINEWRLHRRKQRYPYIFICKPTPPKTQDRSTIVRTLVVGIILLRTSIARVFRWTLSALDWARIIMASFANGLVSIAIRKHNGRNIDPATAAMSAVAAAQENELVCESFSHQVVFDQNDDRFASESSPEQSLRDLRRAHGVMLASPTIRVDPLLSRKAPQHEQSHFQQQLLLPTHPPSASRAITRGMQRSDQDLELSVVTMKTLAKHAPAIDPSPLSEQMRKRRSVGDEVSVGRSVKKPRLNDARTTLEGCTVRPRASWQARSTMNKRQRDEREERIVKDMNRKRSKPGPQAGASTEFTSTTASETPSFQFGTTSTSNGESSAGPGSATNTASSFGGENQHAIESAPPSSSPPTWQSPAKAFDVAASQGNKSASNFIQPSATATQGDNQNSSGLPFAHVQFAFHGTAQGQATNPPSQPGSHGETAQSSQLISQQQEPPTFYSASAGQQPAQPITFGGSTVNNENQAPDLQSFSASGMNGTANDGNKPATEINGTSSHAAGMNGSTGSTGSTKPPFGATAPPPSVAALGFGHSTAPSNIQPLPLAATAASGINGMTGLNGHFNPLPSDRNGSSSIPLFGSAQEQSPGFSANISAMLAPGVFGTTNGTPGHKSQSSGVPNGQQLGTAGARRRAKLGQRSRKR